VMRYKGTTVQSAGNSPLMRCSCGLPLLGCGRPMAETAPDLVFDSPSPETLADDGALWHLYDSAFPSTEREARSVILETLRRGDGVVVRARQNNSTIGMAFAHMLRHPPVLFMVYLAVAPELRSRHIGAALFEKLWAAGRKIYSERATEAEGMVWEVDIPERATSKLGLQQSRRRIAFFERLGGRLLPAAYFQPPVDGITAVPMYLMFRPAPGRCLPDIAAHSALVRALYFEKYHVANAIPEAVLQHLLNKIQGQDAQ
jgi:GNAT superfamily N-acetyltransferase